MARSGRRRGEMSGLRPDSYRCSKAADDWRLVPHANHGRNSTPAGSALQTVTISLGSPSGGQLKQSHRLRVAQPSAIAETGVAHNSFAGGWFDQSSNPRRSQKIAALRWRQRMV